MKPLAPAPISFRRVAQCDGEELASLRVEAMRESLARLGRFDPMRARMRFLDDYLPAQTREIVCGGERVGFFALVPDVHGLHLDHLYVRPSQQSRGIGTAVLAAVLAVADAQGVEVRATALRGSASNHFYVQRGFELVQSAEFDHYYVRRPRGGAPA